MTTASKRRRRRFWYAEWCPRGCDKGPGDSLMIFQSREERDEMVERINRANFEHWDGCARPITRKDATALYRLQDIGTDFEREVLHSHTCVGRPYFEVGSKLGGPILQ